MPRKSKSNTTAAAPKRTIDDLDDDQLYALTCQHKTQYEAALAAKKKSDADFKNCCKLAKSECGAGAIDDIKNLIALHTDEGEEKLKGEVERMLRTMRWSGVAVGTQPGLFDDMDRTPATEKAFADGKRAGLAGETARPPHAPETEQYREWMAGHGEGQSTIAKGFKAPANDEGDQRPRFKQNDPGAAGEAVDTLARPH
jgi:hypothetical protein